MRREPNKKLIGLFLLIGFIIFAIIIGNVVRKEVFPSREHLVVMYFDESVKGLSVGSSVVFKGVEIGKVAKIELISSDGGLDFRIPVFVRLNPGQWMGRRVIQSYVEERERLDYLIREGLRARLITQNYLTGQLMIELEMFPGSPLVLRSKNPHAIEIPTILSPIGELSKNVQELPIKQTLESLNGILGELDKQMPIIMPQIASITKNLNRIVSAGSKPGDNPAVNFNKTMFDIQEAAKAIRNLSDYLERHPEALLKGKRGGY